MPESPTQLIGNPNFKDKRFYKIDLNELIAIHFGLNCDSHDVEILNNLIEKIGLKNVVKYKMDRDSGYIRIYRQPLPENVSENKIFETSEI